MIRFKVLTAIVTLAGMAGLGNTAQADPYADDVVSLQRVTQGWTSGGTALTVTNDDTAVDGGIDVTGRPDFVSNDFRTMTALGFDEISGEGGVLELDFTDNLCLDGFGNDVLITEGGNNEGGLIEVSDDSGLTYVPLGVAGPANGFRVDAAGQVEFFNRVRITAADFAGAYRAAGVDLDSVKCLTSLPQSRFASVRDQCEFSRGSGGLDVMNAVVYSEYGTIRLTLDMCNLVPQKGPAIFRVNFDYRDQSNNDGDGIDDGPDTLDANPECQNTVDYVAKYEDRTESGGDFTFDGDRVTVDVLYADLGVGPGDEVLVWIDTQEKKNIGDTVPTLEIGDRCSMPQTTAEVMSIVLR